MDQILVKLGPEFRQNRGPRDVLPPQGLNAPEAWIERRPLRLQRIPLRVKVPRRPENVIGDTRQLQIEANRETEKGHPNVISARDMGTS